MDVYSSDSEGYEEDLDSNDVSTKNAIFPSTKQTLTIVILLIVLLIFLEKIFISLFLFIIPNYFLLIIVLIIIHLFLLRVLIYACIFPGKNIFVDFYLRTVFGKIRAKSFHQTLEKFKSRIDKVIKSSSNIDSVGNSVNAQLLSKSKLSSKYVDTYVKIKEKYGTLSPYAQEFLDNLVFFKDQIENSSLQENFRKYFHKEQIVITEKDLKDYEEIKKEAEKIQKILSDFRGDTNFSFSNIPKYFRNLFYNDILKSKEFTRVSAMIKKPNSQEITIINKDNLKLDCLIIYSDNKNEKPCSKNLVIVCGPNLTAFENLINSWDIDSLYLQNDTDILFWNYRGYGFSEGSANFDNICEDVLCVYDYMNENNQYNKIAVHGLSIGGAAACYLSRHRNINLVIADRTFGSVQDIIETFPFPNFLYYLAKLIFFPFISNTDNFMNTNCNKILMNDAEDRTIIDPISLKTSISRKIIRELFVIKEPELNIRHIDSYNILDYALEPEQSSKIYEAFRYTINFIKKKKNSLSLERGVINGENEDKCNKLNEFLAVEENADTNNRHASTKEVLDVFYNKIKSLYSHFWGVGDSLERFIDYHNNLTHFHNFFNNFIIYGPEDASLPDYSLCNIHYIDETLNIFIQDAEQFLNNDDMRQSSDLEIYKKFDYFVDCLKNLKVYLLSLHLEEKEQEWIKKIKGTLIPLYCGHILFYDEKELETLKYLIKNAMTDYDIIIPPLENKEESL